MGDYKKDAKEFRNGRPVWKHTHSNAEFYYAYLVKGAIYDENNYWIVKSNRAKIASRDRGLEYIPTGRWAYYDYYEGNWQRDETLAVQGG